MKYYIGTAGFMVIKYVAIYNAVSMKLITE